jgi:nucleoside phosphorylase
VAPSPPEPDAGSPSTDDALGAADRKQRVVVLTSRRAEYEGVVEDGSFSRKLVQNHAYWAHDSDRFQVRITHVGTGPEQSEKTLGKIQSILEGDLLIVAGTAGALHEDLEAGDVYVPTALAPTDAVDWEHPDQELLHWLVGWLKNSELVNDETEEDGSKANLRLGPMVTSPRPVINADQREELKNLTGAMAVDMESAHVLKEFRHSQDEEDQWVGIRVISDGPDVDSESEAEAKQQPACDRLNNILQSLIQSL